MVSIYFGGLFFYNETMKLTSYYSNLKRALTGWWQRFKDGLFPHPAEVRLLEVLGGITVTIGRIQRGGRPLTFILSEGKLLKSEHFRRVAADNKTVLYMNDVQHVLAIRADDFKRDVIGEFEADEALREQGYRIRSIPESLIINNPRQAKLSIQKFIFS